MDTEELRRLLLGAANAIAAGTTVLGTGCGVLHRVACLAGPVAADRGVGDVGLPDLAAVAPGNGVRGVREGNSRRVRAHRVAIGSTGVAVGAHAVHQVGSGRLPGSLVEVCARGSVPRLQVSQVAHQVEGYRLLLPRTAGQAEHQ